MRTLWIVIYAASLTACGYERNGKEDRTDVAPTGSSGYLKGPSVAGLRYQAADATPTTGALPVTDAAGRFELNAANIRIFIGGLEIGTSATGGVLNWSKLGRSQQELANIATLLRVADEDGNPHNGFSIPERLTARAMTWQLNFSSPTFVTDLEAVVLPDIQSVYGRTPVVPTTQAAMDVINSGFRCVYSGLYQGQWVQTSMPQGLETLDPGTRREYQAAGGEMLTLVTTPAGRVVGHQQYSGGPVAEFVDPQDLPVESQPTFQWQGLPTEYNGRFPTLQNMSGGFFAQLTDAAGVSHEYSGNMNGERIAGAANAVQRFAVNFAINKVHYLLSLDIDANQRPSATVIVDGGKPVRLTGEIQGQLISLRSASGDYRLDGELQGDRPVITGTWTDSANGTTKSFAGATAIVGCRT